MEYIFSANLLILSLDHLVTGALALFFPVTAIKFYKIVFGADIPFTSGHLFILKPWGALGVFAGVVGVLAMLDPVRYSGVLWMLVVLLIFRIYIRVMNTKKAEIHLHLSSRRNLMHIGLITLCALIICIQVLSL